MKTILVTGFGPFGNTPINPAEGVARALHGTQINGVDIVATIVPCAFFESIAAAQDAIEQTRPDAVIMLGEYGGRSMITVERIAQNFNDSTRYQFADNNGVILQDVKTVEDGPDAYYSTLPIRAMVTAMRRAQLPADISDASGTIICNHLFYGVLHYITTRQLPIRAGWVHLPHLPSTAALTENLGAPSMSLETSLTGVQTCIEAVIEHSRDIDDPVLSCWQI
jgi:pyroglutamyl-peptidase